MLYDANDYPKDKAHRADLLRQAAHDHLVHEAQEYKINIRRSRELTHDERRLLFATILIVLVILLSLILTPSARAQAVDMADPGSGDPLPDAIMAYRIGHYYHIKGDYDQAIENYTNAIEQIPASILKRRGDYAMIYWDLGDAHLLARHHNEALKCYQTYLRYRGAKASKAEATFVKQLAGQIAGGTISLKPLAV